MIEAPKKKIAPYGSRPHNRSAAFGLAIAIAIALLWQGLTIRWKAERADRLSERVFRPVPAGMAGGGKAEVPPQLIHPIGADGCIWLRWAEEMVQKEDFRLREVDFDNAPSGRPIHWDLGFAWWLIFLGRANQMMTGLPLEAALTDMANLANPILFCICLIVFPVVVYRRWGVWPAIALLAALLGNLGFQVGFLWGVVDHHGLHNAAILACLLGLGLGGLGWVRTDDESGGGEQSSLPGRKSARRGFIFSGVAASIGLWVSAVTMSVALVGIGLGAVSAFLAFGRLRAREGELSNPRLWRWWGYSGAAGSLALYLLEYGPNHFEMRLEVNHPLYALALAGAGELLCFLQGVTTASAWSRSAGGWIRAGLATLSILVLPFLILTHGSQWYLPFDRFLFHLHGGISECTPFYWEFLKRSALDLVTLYGTPAMIMILCASCIPIRAIRLSERSMLLFVAGTGLVFVLALLYQLRWAIPGTSVWVAAAPFLALSVQSLARKREKAGMLPAARTVLLAVLLGLLPFKSLIDARASRNPNVLLEDEGMQLLYRDVAQFLRSYVGPGDGVVLLSSPNATLHISHYGRFGSVGTLYWENISGLRAAAEIMQAQSDDEALRLIQQRGVTHLVLIKRDQFIFPPVDGSGPADLQGWKRTFGWRTAFGRSLPIWLRPLPYRIPPALKALETEVMVAEVAPEQTVAEAAFHLGEYFLVNEDLEGAEANFRAIVGMEPRAWDARWKLGETLLARGEIAEAERELIQAIDLAPDSEAARLWFEAGSAFAAQGAQRVAADFLSRAQVLVPGNLTVLVKLSWLLSTSSDASVRDGGRALLLARDAVELAPANPAGRMALAAAHAETGDFTAAAEAADRAEQLAARSGNQALVELLRNQMRSYRAAEPWRE